MTEILADLLLRETYRPHTLLARMTPRPMADDRAALIRARRFVLDDAMAAFMADLSQVPFQVAGVRRPEVLDTIRHGARLPHAATWIEFSGRAFRARLLEVAEDLHDATGAPLEGPESVPPRWGWLLEEHPQVPQAVSLTEVVDMNDGTIMMLPFHFVWQTTDAPLPWLADSQSGEFAHGIIGYHCPQIGVIYDCPTPPQRRVTVRHDGAPDYQGDQLVVEMGGIVRYAMCLLATLNDVPAVVTEVRQDRGFVARGTYRKYLDHATIRLVVPARANPRRLAKKLIALARRRAHQVRGHWRLYQRGPGEPCPNHAHSWGPAGASGRAQCQRCSAWRTWITEHQRGDASLGFVTHDYTVLHDEHPTKQ